jgi:hypothetical protein
VRGSDDSQGQSGEKRVEHDVVIHEEPPNTFGQIAPAPKIKEKAFAMIDYLFSIKTSIVLNVWLPGKKAYCRLHSILILKKPPASEYCYFAI